NRIASGHADGRVYIWEGKRDPKEIEPRWRVWRQQRARASEQAGDLFAAAFHLRQMLQEAPDDATVKGRLAKALGGLDAEHGRWAEAVDEFEKARQVQPHPVVVEYSLAFALLGRANASAPAAIAASRTLAALSAPYNYSPLTAAAPYSAFSWQGDLADYRHVCAELVRDHGQTANPTTADDVVFVCVLRPRAVDDPALLVQLARKAVDSDPDNGFYRETLGAALYRAGDFNAALRELNLAVEKQGQGGSPLAKLFLAMARYRLKDPKAANDCFSRAMEQVRSQPLPWNLRPCLQGLGDEAEALLQSGLQP
ncbi:MAG TPA: hypothetical protein VMS17_23055, partial [Gemmataceae bacterium]|nr:hypothetical protein [Gemmataceae bacterium]